MHALAQMQNSAHRLLLHREFSLKGRASAIDRGDRQHTTGALVFQQAIPGRDVAVDGNLVPLLGMTDIIDRHVIVLAPEKRYRVEDLALPQHIARGGLALAFCHHPMLDPDILPGMRIGPARDIARSIDSGDAGFEECIHRNTAVELEASLFGQRQARPHSYADNHKVGLQHATALERRALAVDREHGILEMEDDAVLLMQCAHEIAHFGPEYALHRPLFRRHYVDLDTTRA